jgi:hypothetical protein
MSLTPLFVTLTLEGAVFLEKNDSNSVNRLELPVQNSSGDN